MMRTTSLGKAIVATIEVACPTCGDEITDDRCGPCQADEIFREFLEAMSEIEFIISETQNFAEWKIMHECYHGDVRAYFLDSWEQFITQK